MFVWGVFVRSLTQETCPSIGPISFWTAPICCGRVERVKFSTAKSCLDLIKLIQTDPE